MILDSLSSLSGYEIHAMELRLLWWECLFVGICRLMLWNLPKGLSRRVRQALTSRLNRAVAEPSQAARASGEEKKEEREAMGSPAPKETSEGKKRGHEADDDALVFKKPRTPEENFELMARCTKELITVTKVIKDMLEVIQGQDDIGEAITSAANATRKELEGLIHGIAATEKGIAYYASNLFGFRAEVRGHCQNITKTMDSGSGAKLRVRPLYTNG